MGGTGSKIKIDQSVLNQAIVNVMVKNNTKTATGATTQMDMNLSNIEALSCVLDVTQTGTMKVTSIQEFTNDTSASLVTSIMNSLEAQLSQQIDEKSGFLSTPEGKKQKTDVTTHVENLLKTNFTTENLNELVSKAKISQTLNEDHIVLDPCGFSVLKGLSESVQSRIVDDCPVPRQECKVDQNLALTMVSQQIGANVTKILAEDKDVQDFTDKVDQKQKITSTGLFQDLGKAIQDFFTGISLPFLVIGLVLLFMFIALIVWFIKSGSKPTNIAQAATMVAVPEEALAAQVLKNSV